MHRVEDTRAGVEEPRVTCPVFGSPRVPLQLRTPWQCQQPHGGTASFPLPWHSFAPSSAPCAASVLPAWLPSTSPLPELSSLASLSCFLGLGSGCAHNIYFPVPAAFCALVLRGSWQFQRNLWEGKKRQCEGSSRSLLLLGLSLTLGQSWECVQMVSELEICWVPFLRNVMGPEQFVVLKVRQSICPFSPGEFLGECWNPCAVIAEAMRDGARSGRTPKSMHCSGNMGHPPV